jgi:hypothetical protein
VVSNPGQDTSPNSHLDAVAGMATRQNTSNSDHEASNQSRLHRELASIEQTTINGRISAGLSAIRTLFLLGGILSGSPLIRRGVIA